MLSAKRRESKQEFGVISCASSANGCDDVVDRWGSDVNASTMLTVHAVCDTAATMPVVGADLSKVVGSFKGTPDFLYNF